ncbi:substrate-binding domain-containing protein [Paenibacillus sp. sgz302251]|uniref:substrate-binding domain-containing protein n=1 Tax=Paenibacillus sp. sgz302251 TaxID=3414493 RepID=UPI003C7AF88A
MLRQKLYVSKKTFTIGIIVPNFMVSCGKGDFNKKDGYSAMKRLWDEARTFTAIFSANDEMALGIYETCREAEISIPKDLSAFGLDSELV